MPSGATKVLKEEHGYYRMMGWQSVLARFVNHNLRALQKDSAQQRVTMIQVPRVYTGLINLHLPEVVKTVDDEKWTKCYHELFKKIVKTYIMRIYS